MKTVNLWVRPLKQTTCPCGQRKTEVWAWGKYIAARWYTINHFCQTCFETRVIHWVKTRTQTTKGQEVFVFKAYRNCAVPSWLRDTRLPSWCANSSHSHQPHINNGDCYPT